MICREILLLSTGGKLALVPSFVEEKMEKMWNFGFYFFTQKLNEIPEIGLRHSLGHAALHLWISIRETSNVDRLRVIGTCLKFPFFCTGVVPLRIGPKISNVRLGWFLAHKGFWGCWTRIWGPFVYFYESRAFLGPFWVRKSQIPTFWPLHF